MKRLIISVILAMVLLVLPVSGALAATDTATVTVTATPSYVSISVTSATGTDFDFGGIDPSSTNNTGTGYFTLVNASGVVTDITLACDGWSGTSFWAYGAAASDQGRLMVSGDNPGTGGSGGPAAYDLPIPTSGGVLLNDDLAAAQNVLWEMQLDAPTAFTHGYEQTTIVTITATSI